MGLTAQEIIDYGNRHAGDLDTSREAFQAAINGNFETSTHPIVAVMRMDEAVTKVGIPRHLQEALIQHWITKVPQWYAISTKQWEASAQLWLDFLRKNRDYFVAKPTTSTAAAETQTARVLENPNPWVTVNKDQDLSKAA